MTNGGQICKNKNKNPSLSSGLWANTTFPITLSGSVNLIKYIDKILIPYPDKCYKSCLSEKTNMKSPNVQD